VKSLHFPSSLAIRLLALVLGAACSLAFGAQPDFDSPEFQSLVKQSETAIQQLSSDDYPTRRMAFAKLIAIGRPAIEPLEKAQQSEDPEVRQRAVELLIELRGRGFLGVSLSEMVDEDGDGLPDPEANGLPVVRAGEIVSHLNPTYARIGLKKPLPAEAAGMERGDKLLAVNDRPVHGIKDLMREVICLGPARQAVITIERAGEMKRVPVVLTRNPFLQRAALQYEPEIDAPPVDLEKELEHENGEPSATETHEHEREFQAEGPAAGSAPAGR
jgi:membrane-associated protease RseP (regulator of RpoE activity)